MITETLQHRSNATALLLTIRAICCPNHCPAQVCSNLILVLDDMSDRDSVSYSSFNGFSHHEAETLVATSTFKRRDGEMLVALLKDAHSPAADGPREMGKGPPRPGPIGLGPMPIGPRAVLVAGFAHMFSWFSWSATTLSKLFHRTVLA